MSVIKIFEFLKVLQKVIQQGADISKFQKIEPENSQSNLLQAAC